MSLLTVLNEFLRQSGRYDLGTIDDVPNSDRAVYFINAGVKLLDRRIYGDDLQSRVIHEMAIGEHVVLFRKPKTISNVWMIESDDSVTELERRKFETIRNYYGERIADMDNGTPLYWAPVALNIAPDVVIDSIDDILIDDYDFLIDTSGNSNAILIAPAPDTAISLDILGRFFNPTLGDAGDSNQWTERYPHLLVMAAQYYVELAHRNTEGAKDWLAGIDLDLMEIDMADVAYDTEDIDQMRG